MSAFTEEVRPQLNAMGLLLGRIVREYYQDPEHRKEFEDWYLEKYGKPYVWK